MPSFKKQHYLPAVYLREFSADKARGDAQVWRCDGKQNGLVSVRNECCADYFYSKEQPASVEKMFQNSEGFYAECIRAIQSGKAPARSQFFGLILIIFDLHLRNAAYENQTGKDNLHAYRLRLHGLKKLLLDRQDDELTDDEVWEHLKNYWRVRILLSSPGNEFVTSDNPSILFASQDASPNLQFTALPFTPIHMAIAYDCRRVEVTGEQTCPQDEELLNRLQLSNAWQCVYSSVDLSVEQQRFIGERLNRKSSERAKTDEAGWEVSMQRLAPDVNFSFTRSTGRASGKSA